MFLPLGFGGRFPRFPWITSLLCLSLFLVHQFYGRDTMKRLEALHDSGFRKIVASPTYPKAVAIFCSGELPKGLSLSGQKLLETLAAEGCPEALSLPLPEHIKTEAIFHRAFVALGVLPHAAHFGLGTEVEPLLERLNRFNKEHAIFSGSNRDFAPLLASQFLHADWLHLFGNLLVLFLVGCLVECRRSPWVMLGTFVVGGLVGFVFDVSQQTELSYRSLIGASAGISAVAGLFTASFFRFRMKFLLFVIPPFYKTFHASSLVVLPLIFLAGDLLNSLALDTSTGVAHLAHLGGSAFGLMVGLGFEKLRPIRWPLLYDFEEKVLEDIERDPNPHERIHQALKLLQINPENMLAARSVCQDVISLVESGFPATPELRDILRDHVPTLLSVHSRRKEPGQAFALAARIPPQISLLEILDRSSQSIILQVMKWAQEEGDRWTVLRFYEVWIQRFAGPRRISGALADVNRLLDELESSLDNYHRLSQLYHARPQGPLALSYHRRLQSMYEILNRDDIERKNIA